MHRVTSTAAILATSQHWLHALAPSTGSGATGGRLVDGAVTTRYWVLVDGGGTLRLLLLLALGLGLSTRAEVT